jgi:PAS domain S-box-containing protein
VPDWNKWLNGVITRGYPVERQVKGRSGSWYLLRVRPYKNSDNKTEGLIVVLLDVDLIKRPLLEEAKESRNFADALLEASEQAIIAFGPDERIIMINSAVERMFLYGRDELVGHPLGLLLPKGVRQRHSEYRRRFVAAPGKELSGLSLDLEGRRKDGAVFPVGITFSIIQRGEQRLGVTFVTDHTENKRLRKVSDQYRQEIVALAAQLMTAQDEERRRVSRELHDSLCQQLASLAFAVEDLATEVTLASARNRLRALHGGIIKVSEEARHMAYELHPSVLDDLGLVASLRALCEDFSKNNNIEVTFTANKPPGTIPRNVASGFYGVAQEALQNIAKHAKATRVSVELAISRFNIGLSVKDDGLGFDASTIKSKGGLGLISMGERARMMGGAFSIETRPKHGVRIGVIVPSL